jgi:hypothetical protein
MKSLNKETCIEETIRLTISGVLAVGREVIFADSRSTNRTIEIGH